MTVAQCKTETEGGASVVRLVFTATIVATTHGAMLVIRGGRIAHVRLGDVTTCARLALSRVELLTRGLKRCALPRELLLAEGIPLTQH